MKIIIKAILPKAYPNKRLSDFLRRCRKEVVLGFEGDIISSKIYKHSKKELKEAKIGYKIMTTFGKNQLSSIEPFIK